MEFAYCEGMSNAQPSFEVFKVNEKETIKKGDVLSLNEKGFVTKSGLTDISIGVAMEDYPTDDASGLISKRNVIKVATSGNAVYRVYGKKINFMGECTDTKVYPVESEGILYSYYRSFLVLISKSPESQNTDNVGDVRTISYVNPEGSLVAMNVSKGGIPHPDDVYAIMPNIGDTYFKDLNESEFKFDETEGHFRCVGVDFSTNNVKGLPSFFVKLNKHSSTSKINS